MKLRMEYEIGTEQKAIYLAGNVPSNYEVGDIRYVEWLEEQLGYLEGSSMLQRVREEKQAGKLND